MEVVLISGLWLDPSAWDPVLAPMKAAGHRPVPVSLPGQGDGSTSATLDDQLSAAIRAVDDCRDPVAIVGHSAACSLAWTAADARPEKTAEVVMIGGFPTAAGNTYADLFKHKDGVRPFPGWDRFEGPDSHDLDDPTRGRMAAAFVPVPEGVAKGVMTLSDTRRYELPVVIVRPELSVEQARGWIAEGTPELKKAKEVSYVIIDSGHWPMLTRAVELAQILSELADA